MAWEPVITTGDRVNTPHGVGTLRRKSETNQTAQVDVDGQLFEVPLTAVSKASGGAGEPKPAKRVNKYLVKKGDRVQERGNPRKKGQVTEVTQRTVRVKWDSNGSVKAFPKASVGAHLDQAQADEQPAGQPDSKEIKVGDKVKLTQHHGGSANVGDIGEVKEVNGQKLEVDFPTHPGNYHVPKESVEKVEEPKPEQAEQSGDKATDTADGLYDLFKIKEHLEKRVDKEVDAGFKELKEMAKKTQKLEVKVGDKTVVVEGLKHKQLEQLITYAAMRLNPLLVGMAGTGKTHAGSQCAEALGLDFYSMSVGAQTSKSDIIGYMSAGGEYVTTHFRKAYEGGGVFLMDEVDAGNANVLIQINAALSNGLCAFPDKMVKRHEDFVFIASANTYGNGANRQYVGRNQLDAATLDRFAVIDWLIDDDLEESLAVGLNGKAWYMAVRAARDYVAEKSIRALVSPRATQKGSLLLDAGQALDEVIDATLLASVPDDKRTDVRQVATKIFEKFASEVPGQLPKSVNPDVGSLVR